MNNTPFRVAVFDSVVSAGGIRRFTLAMLRSWLAMTHPEEYHFTLFWPTHDTAGLPLSIPFDPCPPHLTAKLLQSIGPQRGLDWLAQQSTQFDLIYFPTTTNILSADQTTPLAAPTVTTLHDLAHEYYGWPDVQRETRQWANFAQGLIFSSDYIRAEATRLYHIDPDKTFRVYLAPPLLEPDLPDTSEISQLRAKYNLPEQFALSPGTAMPHKNPQVVIEAMGHLKQQGFKLPLVLIGPLVENLCPGAKTPALSPYHQAIQQQILELGLELNQDLFILNHVPDAEIPAFYAAASVIITATRSEAGLSGPVLEGMWYQRPVICSALPQFTERLGTDDQFVYMFAPTDADDLAHAVQRWAIDPPGANHRVQEAYTYISQRTWDDAARDYLSVFQETADRYRAMISYQAATHQGQGNDRSPQLPGVDQQPVASTLPQRQTPPVLWQAPVFDPSGYADEARNFILNLQAQGFDLAAKAIGRHSEAFRQQLDLETQQKLNHALTGEPAADFINVIHFPAYAFQRLPQAAYHIGRVMFETDGLPADWVAKCNQMDEIWVPSDFNLKTFRNAGVTTTLIKIPGGIDTKQFRPGLEPLPLPGTRGLVFLSIFEWSYRKGWDILLRAWANAFKAEDNVSLVLRTYPVNKTDTFDGRQIIDQQIDQFLQTELGLTRNQIAPIVVLGDQIPEQDMPRLYNSVQAYVSCSRGEGWGRPQMQAMACGLPVIATRWGGNLEFMTDENSLLVDINGLVNIDTRMEIPFYYGQRWAEPSVEYLTQILQWVYTAPAGAAVIGQQARRDMVNHWQWEKVATLAAERLFDIHSTLSGDSKRVSVRWEGSQFVTHSLALINREICLRLAQESQVDLSIIPYEADQFGPEVDARYEHIRRNLTRPLAKPTDIHIRHQWPPNLIPPPQGRWVMIQPWEFGSIPKAWIETMAEQVDEVWAYTNYVRECYLRSGMPTDRVKVVPPGVDISKFHPNMPPFPLKTGKGFKFLFVGGTIARKGIDILIETYIRTFTKQNDVCLVIKDMGGQAFYKGQTAGEMIVELQARPDTPEIEYIDQTLNDAELAGLYTACDCLVHPYRGEGFGLPIAEAMASGLPVIVTGYGAALDFCHNEIAYLIPAVEEKFPEKRLGQTETVSYPWWAQPNRDKLKEFMEYVVVHPAEAKAKGQAAAAHIRANFTWEQSVRIVQERFEVLRQKPIQRFQAKPADLTPAFDDLNDTIWGQVDSARRAGDWSAAATLLQKAIALNTNGAVGLSATDTSSLWNSLGYCYMMNENLAAAENAFTDGLKVAPNNMDLLNNLAELYLLQENYEEATSCLTHALKVNPNDVNILLSLGNCCVQLNEFDTALTAFRRVQKLAPATPGLEEVIQQLEMVPGA